MSFEAVEFAPCLTQIKARRSFLLRFHFGACVCVPVRCSMSIIMLVITIGRICICICIVVRVVISTPHTRTRTRSRLRLGLPLLVARQLGQTLMWLPIIVANRAKVIGAEMRVAVRCSRVYAPSCTMVVI